MDGPLNALISRCSVPRATEEGVHAPIHVTRRRGSTSFPVLLLIVLLAVVGTVLCYQAIMCKYDSGLRKAVTEHLREAFPDASIFVGRVTSDGPSSLIVSDLRLAIKKSNPKQQFFAAERVVLKGDLDISDWLRQSIALHEIHLHGLQVDAWPTADQHWSVEQLKPKTNKKMPPPALFLHDAIIRIRKSFGEQSATFALHDVHGKITPHLKASSDGKAHDFHVQLTGQSSGRLQRISVEAAVNLANGTFIARGDLNKFHFEPELITQLPHTVGQYLEQLKGVECMASASYTVSGGAGRPTSYHLRGKIDSGRIIDPRLPYPLEKINADFECQNSLLKIRQLSARSGSAELTLNSNIYGFALDQPMVIQAEYKNLDLDQRLYRSLTPKLQEQWDKLQPQGQVSGSIQLSFDGKTWKPTALIQCEQVSIRPWLFPYLLTNVAGQVRFQNNTLSSERLRGEAGGQVVEGSFSLTKQAEQWLGMMQVKSLGTVSIDEQLISALTGSGKETSSAESFIRTLHPSGSLELMNAKFERTAEDPKWRRTLDINVYDSTIRYEKFAYPIYDVRGRIVCRNNSWELLGFEGRNGSGYIRCSGNWQSGTDGALPFSLEFKGSSIPLADELRDALPIDVQTVWRELRPTGSLDAVNVTISRALNTEEIATRVELNEDSTANAVQDRSLRLHPKSFPYWLNEVGCKIAYEAGKIDIEYASATNGATRLALEGRCEKAEDGRWQAYVQWRPTTRVMVDREFLQALPDSMRKSLLKLDFQGPLGVIGASNIRFPNTEIPLTTTVWNCRFDIEDGRLATGDIVNHVRGTLQMAGSHHGENLNANGHLVLDALTFKGIPVTNVTGPFAIRENKLFFGSSVGEYVADYKPPGSGRLTAKALAGELTMSGQGRLDEGKFTLDAGLRNAELQALLQDVGVALEDTNAQCNANLHYTGVPWSPQTWAGNGVIQLRDANLYELPFMVRLLRVASVSENDSAFQQADIKFDLDGDRIPLEIVCEGEVLRLKGEGWTTLRRELHLELYSYVGRRSPLGSVFSPVFPDSKLSTLMAIDVDGTLDNPIMEQRVLPQLEATLQQWFPDVQEVNR